MKMLKLIAIQNHLLDPKKVQDKRRFNNIYKVLEPISLYYFCKGYKVEKGKVVCHPEDHLDGKLYSEGYPCVDICAVVGKNGSGKSSLIELYLRIMNNLAYVCHRAIGDGSKYNTQFVDEIYSTVFFYDTDKNICHSVKQDGAKLSYLKDGVEQFVHNYDKPFETAEFKQDVFPIVESAKACLKELCYTMVINYSAYSYNHEDYLPEWVTIYNNSTEDDRDEAERMEDRCWIDSLFHKNDGYQLPIVLNPFREDGMVDYNNERELTQDRLYNLTLLQSSPITTILNGKLLDRFVFDVDDDLSPTGNKMYASYKVLSQLQSMGVVQEVKSVSANGQAEDYGKKVITAWSKCFGVDFASYAEEKKEKDGTKRNPHVLQALNYIVYKTLKIAQTYQRYNYYKEIDSDTKKIEAYVKNLYNNDRSHITQKIRRCMTFIVFRHYKGNELPAEQLKSTIQRKYKARKKWMRKARKDHQFKRFDDVEEYEWTEDDFLPAPSFKVSMYLKSDGLVKQTMIGLNTMSSGERQFINTISTLAYHLSNVESVWRRISEGTNEIGYKNVCVFFDEMDLYLHPEYQTKMIQLMLQVIEELKLEYIKSIQIICASHSPFILSDIPRRNVMYLERGKAYSSGKMKTFAANIGDLLCHSFFLTEGLIGCFARDRVDSLVDWLEEKRTNTKWDYQKAEEFISLIDDPFVSMQLKLMLKEKVMNKEHTDEENKD